MQAATNGAPRLGATLYTTCLADVERRVTEGIQAHTLCDEVLQAAVQDSIPRTTLLERAPMFIDREHHTVRPLYGVWLQYTQLTTYERNLPAGTTGVTDWRADPSIVQPPVPLVVAWGKPYIYIVPLPGLTPEGWQAQYPRFHMNVDGGVCVGRTFRIGEATNALTQLPALIALLSCVNMTDPMYRLAQASLDYGEPWTTWYAAQQQIETGHPEAQSVFTRLQTLDLG